MIRRQRRKPTPRLKGTKAEAAAMIRLLLRAGRHNEFDHDTDAQARKCEHCKLNARAAKLAEKLESAE